MSRLYSLDASGNLLSSLPQVDIGVRLYLSLCLDLEKYFKHLSLIHQVLSLVSHLSMLVSIDLRENASLVKLPMYRTKVIIIYMYENIYKCIAPKPR